MSTITIVWEYGTRHASRFSCGIALLVLLLQAVSFASGPSQDLIVDINTEPNKYWNKDVTLKGHVVKVTPEHQGTNRGLYSLRDQSDMDIEIETRALPAPGTMCIVHGTVVQRNPGDTVPVIEEISRKSVPEDAAVETVSTAESKKKTVVGAVRQAKRIVEKKDVSPAPAQPAVEPSAVPVAPEAGVAANNTIIIGLVVVAVLMAVTIVVIVMKKKPVPADMPPPKPASAGSSTVVAGKGTEAFTKLGGELTVIEGQDRGRTCSISRSFTLIGRPGQRKNDFELTDATASREQAKISYDSADRSFKIINESSTNPTRINGRTIESAVLQDGDKIEFGNTIVRFRKE